MLILASASPRRKDLLTLAGFEFEVRVAGIPEERAEEELPELYVVRLAREKAAAVEADAGDFVLAADTTVAVDHHVLEKPLDDADAARMLRLLSGRVHSVWTGICVRHGERLWSAVEETVVSFLPLKEQDVQDYLATGEQEGKAGAYAIQGVASRFVDRIEGCYFNVVGLPVSRVTRLLAEAGYRPRPLRG